LFASLAPQVDNPNTSIGIRAVQAMRGQIVTDPAQVIAFVKKTLKHDHPKIRAGAVLLLPANAQPLPVASSAMKDGNALVRSNTMRWTRDSANVKPDAALALLVLGLGDDQESVSNVARN